MEEKNAEQMKKLKQLREITGLNRKQFAESLGIPLRTVEDWEAGRRKMPDYVLRLLAYKIHSENPENPKSARNTQSTL